MALIYGRLYRRKFLRLYERRTEMVLPTYIIVHLSAVGPWGVCEVVVSDVVHFYRVISTHLVYVEAVRELSILSLAKK